MKVVNLHTKKVSTSNGIYWLHTAAGMSYTDGVKNLVDENDCEWLIDLVLVLQQNPLLRQHRFQVWELRRITDDAFYIKAFESDGYQIHIGLVPAILCPLDSCTLWLSDGVLMLPSEY